MNRRECGQLVEIPPNPPLVKGGVLREIPFSLSHGALVLPFVVKAEDES